MEIDLWVEPGTLLAAGPDLLDPNFMHTVVLMGQHSAQGAYGLVINRPAKQKVREVLPEHPLLGQVELPMHVGGPVGLDTMQILHRAPERLSGGVQIADSLWIGGDLDVLARYLREHPGEAESNVRLFVGYSGWGAGQLELELASGSWLPAPGSGSRVFDAEPRTLWREVVRSLGEETRGLEDQPPDPTWN